MKRLAATFALLGAVTALTHAQSPRLIIRGRVVASETGDPLAHARVVIYNDATPLPPLYTDAEGRFVSRALPSSRYYLSATKTGYALTRVAGQRVVAPGGVEVRMRRSSAIAGRVLDPFGEPSIGLAINVREISQPGDPQAAAVTRIVPTDDLGEYRVGGLTAGTYVVSANSLEVSSTGEVHNVLSYYPGVPALADAQRITLQPGDQKSGIDFSGVTNQAAFVTAVQLIQEPRLRIFSGPPAPLNPANGTGVIRGFVTRADGLPLAHATVSTTAGPSRQPSVMTDDEGRYEFVDLPKGTYRISASKAGFTSAAYGEKAGAERGEFFTLQDNQTRTGIDITLPRYSAVTGQIVDDFGDPLEGVTVSVSQIRFQAGRRRLAGVNGVTVSTTDDQGHYRIFGLRPGEYIVSASVGQVTTLMAGADVSGFAPTYFPGTTSPGEARALTVARSQDLAGIDLSLVPLPTARVSGRKLGSDGAPLGGSLILTPSQRSAAIVTPPTGARIEDDGRFEFPNVAPGDYVIQADRGRTQGAVEGEFVSQFITVNGTDVGNLLLQATPGSTISGRIVLDGDGTPPPTRTLTVIPERADLDRTPLAGGSIGRADVGDDLTFALAGIHGPRRLTLGRSASGWVLRSVIANGVDITDVPLPFGTAEQSLNDVQVVITNRVTELDGNVADSRGRPATDYSLLIFPMDRDQWYPASRYFRRMPSGASDVFMVRGLPPADYFVAAITGRPDLTANGDDAWQDPDVLEALASRAARVTLTEGQKVSVSARVVTP